MLNKARRNSRPKPSAGRSGPKNPPLSFAARQIRSTMQLPIQRAGLPLTYVNSQAAPMETMTRGLQAAKDLSMATDKLTNVEDKSPGVFASALEYLVDTGQ